MKKLYTILTLSVSCFFFASHAQSQLGACTLTPVAASFTAKSSPSLLAIDTLTPPTAGTMPCGDTAYFYYVDNTPHDSGYAFGNNKYGETQCAQKYYATGSVTEVLVRYPHKYGTSGSNSVKIYSIDAAKKGPSATVLGTSASITTGNLAASGFTSFTFTTPVPVVTAFAAAAVFPTNGDTVAVGSTHLKLANGTPACVAAPYDSLSWENFPAFGGWGTTFGFFTGDKTNSVDFFIWPVVNTVGGVHELPSSNGLTLKGVTPNPASDFANIQYHIDAPALVAVEIFDINGRIIQTSSDNLLAGNHELKVSLKGVDAGNYYYTINTGAAKLTGKLMVTK